MKDYTVDELLASRERRVDFIARLIKRYNAPVLVMRVNYPGLKKTNNLTVSIIQAISPLIGTIVGGKICRKVLTQGAEGPIYYVAVKQDVLTLKTLAIEIEEKHPLGRCLDIDVYNIEGRSISRQEFGYPSRKCYLCEEDAHQCVRSRRHSEYEVTAYIEEKYQRYQQK